MTYNKQPYTKLATEIRDELKIDDPKDLLYPVADIAYFEGDIEWIRVADSEGDPVDIQILPKEFELVPNPNNK
jgi:hypothetical protein